MTVDIARKTFDPKRDWRAVLAQQGRVTLEADVNEQVAIASEAQRREAIDVIGPIGSPDGGYAVTAAGTDVSISAGTIYVSGWRLTLPKEITTASQPGWLDMPPWPIPVGNQIIALQAIEQSAIAVEDQSLLEVALGGPDSAGRLVLLQHVLRIPTTATDCPSAAAALPTILNGQGLSYDPNDCALTSQATLQVTPVTVNPPPGPCDPPATGGYLGADNQMIRVAVTTYDGSLNGSLVWGWNNASFLFRATASATQPNVLTFLAAPIDPDHQPQSGQAVEILRCTIDLGDGSTGQAGTGNFIAAGAGVVMVLAAGQGYATDTMQLTLPNPLPAAYLNDLAQNPDRPFFVRLWQGQIPFLNNTATILGDTGLNVTINMPPVAITYPLAPGAISDPPFWQFAVRPSTPQQVYPQRYLTQPQPPEGPRQFLAPLGVVGWSGNAFQLIEDCSVPFLPLTKLHGCSCCSLTLDSSKDWLTTLTQAINSNPAALSVCFQPGTFNVTAKITFSNMSVLMTGAGAGTQITGPGLEAVLEFDACAEVCLSDLCVNAGAAGDSPTQGTQHLQGAVTTRNCALVNIERVSLSCANADLRSASCLAVYNTVPGANPPPQQYNVRVLNSRFNPGHCQVGILLVNADRAQVEGNVVVTLPQPLGITTRTIVNRPLVAARLKKQLLHAMTIIDTKPPTTARAQARAERRARAAAPRAAPPPATAAVPAHPETSSAATPQATPPVPAGVSTPAPSTTAPAAPTQPARVPPRINLGAVGRAHVRATFGTINLEFISSDKLGNAWNDALRAAGLTASSTMGAVRAAVKKIATNVLTNPTAVAPAFRNWLAVVLPQLYSTSGQGIVVGGDLANDIRILNNTIDGAVQGIHVGLSDLKVQPHQPHLLADHVLVRGNRVNIRLTPEATGDRHGIFLGCATSAVVSDNHLELTRSNDAGQDIFGITVAGYFGPRLLLTGNYMQGFTAGIVTVLDATAPPANVLWKAADNASTSTNTAPTWFNTSDDNVPPFTPPPPP